MIETGEQRMADQFDLDLHRLAQRAENMAVMPDREAWARIARYLHMTRPLVRALMSEQRRKETM